MPAVRAAVPLGAATSTSVSAALAMLADSRALMPRVTANEVDSSKDTRLGKIERMHVKKNKF